MVQSIEYYSLQNISNRINRRRSQTSVLYIKFPGFFRWRALHENTCKGLSMKVQRIAGALSRMSIQNVNHLQVYFCGIRPYLTFFDRRTWCHVCNTGTCTQKISYFHVFLQKDRLSLSAQGKNMFSGKKIPSFQIIQERSCPSAALFENTIFSERQKKILLMQIIFPCIFLRNIIFHFPSKG